MLAYKKGITIDELSEYDYNAFKESQYDKMAQGVRESVDIAGLYELMGMKGSNTNK